MPKQYAILALGLITSCASAEVYQITGVQPYYWYHGCGPTAAGMVIGYWDGAGYGNLIPGSNVWSANTVAVKAMIASTGHIRDYVPSPDRVATTSDPYHPDDCVADFMMASRSSMALGYGGSYDALQGSGMTGYADWAGYGLSHGYKPVSEYERGEAVWPALVREINAGRPVELGVDSDGDGWLDHFVTAFGYDDTPGALRYACYNTWQNQTAFWYTFALTQNGVLWGVESATTFKIDALVAGDANGDGCVGLSDLVAMTGSWAATDADWSRGDFSRDGIVGLKDLVALTGNWSERPEAVATGVQAPEPACLLVLMSGIGWLVGRRG